MTVRPPHPLDEITRAARNAASDPSVSAWVSANAGSGKTSVLVRRVERLLLAGADPGRILCLTFTKAAAAEMAKRVFADLGRWVRLEDTALAAELREMEDRPPDRALLARARRLFARALETPGGLKIQTVHAFCERLLHQFPFEANVPGHFQVLEENAANALIAESRRRVLARAAADLDAPLGQALRTVVLAASDVSHEAAIAEAVEKREALHRWSAAAGSLEAALRELARRLGVDAAETVESVDRRLLDETLFAADDLRYLSGLLRAAGNATALDSADRLDACLAAGEADRLRAFVSCFIRNDGEPRAASRIATNAILAGVPGLEARILAEQERIADLTERKAAAQTFLLSAAILRLADAVLADYDRRKRAQGFLDFDDLVVRTLALLQRSDASRWVHYKIDQGLDHILLDEAQDTSPGQWQVITTLADEFFAGDDAHPGIRTLFAVGDEKQSIYSFQGAVPAWFGRTRRQIEARATAAGRDFRDVHLTVSFRSTPDVLKAVDRMFEPPEVQRGVVGEGDTFPPHAAWRRDQPGRVVIWPLVEPPPQPEPGDWADPLDHLGQAAPEIVLASRIARTIADWLDRGERMEGTGTSIRPGGILVLTRKRGRLSEAINRALKSSGVPVAGADRLALAGHLAVLDLLALGDVVLQDRDDLALAAVLRSPLFDPDLRPDGTRGPGLDEAALFAIAHDRGRHTLWQALTEAANAEPFAAAHRLLVELRERADFVTPYAFYAEVLGAHGGRRRFAARLGLEAEDVIDEFLAQALAYERVEAPSLQGFLAWMRAAATEIRRETETIRDEVRVMTVHGAKGLEADIVFLVDDGSGPAHSSHDPHFLALTDDPDSGDPAPLVWLRGPKRVPAAVTAVRDTWRRRQEEEYRRLLYVAATRARDRLYVCGTLRERVPGGDRCWHPLVTAALLKTAVPSTTIDGSVAFEWRAAELPAALPQAAASPVGPEPELPDWLRRRATQKRAPRSLRPSAAFGEEAPVFSPRATLESRLAGNDALERGRIVHRLLEALPARPARERAAIADRYLAGVAAHWPAEQRAAAAAEVMAILDHPQFAPVFGPDSRAEVEIAGRLATGRGDEALAGRIDRLAVTSERVLIVDYKTNRPAPAGVDEVPPAYVVQLALYRVALAKMYPDRAVAAALLWTDAPRLMEIPAGLLDAAAAQALGAAEPPARGARG